MVRAAQIERRKRFIRQDRCQRQIAVFGAHFFRRDCAAAANADGFSIGKSPQRSHRPVALSVRVNGAVHGIRAAKNPVSNVRRELTAIIEIAGLRMKVEAKITSPSSSC